MQKLRLGIISLLVILLTPFFVFAIDSTNTVTRMEDKDVTYLAEIIEIISDEEKTVPNLDTVSSYQTVVVTFLAGDKKGLHKK